METKGQVPDYIQESFRRDLIKHRGNCGAFGLGYGEELKRFEFYLITIEGFIYEGEKAELAALENQASKLSEEAKGEFWSYYYPVHWDEIFRSNLRPSFLISLISFIEVQLRALCRDIEIIGRTPILAADLKGGFMERSCLFLNKFGSFQYTSEQIWRDLLHIYDVRNVFVHHAGYVPAYNHEKRLRQNLNKANGLLERNGYLSLTRDFCPFALQATERFMNAASKDVAALCELVETSGDLN